MPESTLAITYDDLLRDLGRDLGWSRQPGKWKPDDKADAEDAIKSGLRQFYTPLPIGGHSHRWSFLDPVQSFSTVEPYLTGTVTIASGVVTLAGGTWPLWAASGDLLVGGVSHSVNTRDSGTQVTLDNLDIDASAGTTYQLSQQVYDLPDDFGGLQGDIYFRPGGSQWRTRIVMRSPEEIMRLSLQNLGEPSEPQFYAIRPKAYAGGASEGQRFEMIFDCPTDSVYFLEYRYTIEPNSINPTNRFPYGGAQHSETIRESVLAAGELMLKDEPAGPHRQRFLELLAASIEKDRAEFTPDSLGVDLGDPLPCGYVGGVRASGRTTFGGSPIP